MKLSSKYKEEINKRIFTDKFDFNHQNLLIYGLEEYSESYYINKLLESLYGEMEIRKIEYEIDNYNKSNILIKQSDNHIEFNPSSSGSDRYALLSLIKDFGKSQMVNMVLEGTKNSRRTIIINKIDDLNYYCQASLRRNMEKYSSITNFILISSNL
jgi:DNA polymerase III delta prime subunit